MQMFMKPTGVAARVVGRGSSMAFSVLKRVTGLDLSGPRDAVATRLAGVYAAVLPPAIAFVAGWLATRGTWFRRALTVGVAVLVLAAFPYAAAGAATAGVLVP